MLYPSLRKGGKMDFLDLIAPMSANEFRTKVFGRASVAITRTGNPFPTILTLDEIERKLNDGCATLTSLGLIGDNGSKLPFEVIYNNAKEILWSPFALKKRLVRNNIVSRHSFVMHNMTQINRPIAEIADSIEAAFPDYHVDLHIYVSPYTSSTNYKVHRDSPQHKLYMQLIGTTNWTVYKGTAERPSMSVEEARAVLEIDVRTELTPGSVIYMPPGVYHHVTNGKGPRVSLSFPFIFDPSRRRMDRSYIPLKCLFEDPGHDSATCPAEDSGRFH